MMSSQRPPKAARLAKSDTSILKYGVSSNSQKSTSWVSSSFDDFSAETVSKKTSSSKSVKSKKQDSTTSSNMDTLPISAEVDETSNSGDLWADKYAPTCSGELAVHKKKVEEFHTWLQNSLSIKSKRAPLALLTGPAGAGKTTTVRIVAQELGVEVMEWSNPAADSYRSGEPWKPPQHGDYQTVGGSVFESQATQFQDFLLRANKYPSLQIFHQHQLHSKLILVEEFPNSVFKDTCKFHDTIKSYLYRGHCPLVFIVSDSTGSDSNERLLFPKDLQTELSLNNISFNPVAPTSLVKVLQRVASTEAAKARHRVHVPSKSTLDQLSAASAGDVRGALNALQFACLRDTNDIEALLSKSSSSRDTKAGQKKAGRKAKSGAKSSASQPRLSSRQRALSSRTASSHTSPEDGATDLAAVGGRDTSLFLFRALGKVLYCKRGPRDDASPELSLPAHLAAHHRDPLLMEPEEILDKCSMSGDFFTTFLHQNYMEFFSKVDDLVTATEYLSDADYLSAEWTNRSVLTQYSASVAARGLMYSNSDRAASCGKGGTGLGFKPLHKPELFGVNRKIRSNMESCRELFRKEQVSVMELRLNQLPYLSLLRTQLQNHGQMSFVKEIGRFNKSKFRSSGGTERLDEKDIGMGEDSEMTPAVTSDLTSSQADTEEVTVDQYDDDAVIDDFDD